MSGGDRELAGKIRQLKSSQLDELNDFREYRYREPQLRQLFFELTQRCNEACFHCGSRCGAQSPDGLPVEKYREIIDEVAENFDRRRVQICVTGGEPLLYGDFFPLMAYVHEKGFRWGMTSNATLITREVAGKLHETGMGTISISIDGLEETHDRLRNRPGSWKKAMEGIENLIAEGGFHAIQVTSVMNHENIGELDALYEIFLGMDITSWRVIGLEPIGRALEWPERMLTPEDQRRLFSFIREKREEQMPVTYGCSHYLGLELEREVRDWYFLCNAGIYTAGIMVNGDVGACLDIERRPETIQGNILEDSFTRIWKEEFGIFRQRISLKSAECRACPAEKWCAGGARHSWDYDENRQRICMKGILFDER